MLKYAAIAASVLIGVVLEELVRLPAENHPWTVALVIAVGGVVAAAGLWFVLPTGAWAAPAAILVAGCGWGLVVGWDARDHYLSPYCEYGAKSQAQRDGCLGRVNSDDIDKLDTPAARFARGETTECGTDAGPFCEETSTSP